MIKTVEEKEQGQGASPEEKNDETKNSGTSTEETKIDVNNSSDKDEIKVFKTFNTKEDFDNHSAGIYKTAHRKAENEILAMLGLKPEDKDKLADYKKAYDATLSDAERQAESIKSMTSENEKLKSELAEKDAVISALSKLTGKDSSDVGKFVKMAKGLVDENTTIDEALEQVISFANIETKKTVPSGKPITEPTIVAPKTEYNPFETGNITEQGKLISSDIEKARKMYFEVHHKMPERW